MERVDESAAGTVGVGGRRSAVSYHLVTADVDETRACAGAIAGSVAVGDTIILVGDLGAGKTAFVQGFSAALGVAAPVTSPTFTLANRYTGRLVVNHLDVYRFDHLAEAHDLALPELAEEGVTLVEWGDRITPLLPEERLEVAIGFCAGGSGGAGPAGGAGSAADAGSAGDADSAGVRADLDDDCRLLELRGRGESWRLRADSLRTVLEPWIREKP